MKRATEYIIRQIQNHDIPGLTPFLKEHFYFEEAIFKSLYLRNHSKLSKEELLVIDEDMLNETNYIMGLKSPGIIIIHKESNEIAAAATMFAYENSQMKQQNCNIYQNFQVKSAFFRTYLDLTSVMIEKARVFEHFPETRKALEFDTAAVNRKHRGQGLYMKLIETSIRYAEDNHFDLIYGLFTSDSSKRAPTKLNFKSIADFSLDNYCSSTSRSTLEETPNSTASVMAKVVQ